MPKISEFFGISIYVYWADHPPPHFHARAGGQKMSIAIEDLSVLAGELSPRSLGLVMEWAALHQADLGAVWERAMRHEPTGTIEPLS